MTITRVGAQGGGATFTNTANANVVERAFPANVTAGNLVYAVAIKYDPLPLAFLNAQLTVKSGSTATLSDQRMHVAKANSADLNQNIAIWSAIVATGGSLTLALTSSQFSYVVFATDELAATGGWDSSREEDTAVGEGTGTAQAAAAMTSAGSAILIGGINIGSSVNSTDWTEQAAFSRLYREPDGSTTECGLVMYQIVGSGTTDAIESSTTTSGSMIFNAAGVVLKEVGGAGGPAITATSSATPRQGQPFTVTGSGFGATQGTQVLKVGGVTQAVSSWAAGQVVVAALDRGTNKYGTAVNVEVWDGGSLTSNSFAITSLQPPVGWAYADIGTPAGSGLLPFSPALASGDQAAGKTIGGLVSFAADGTYSVSGTGYVAFDYEGWSTGSGWGSRATLVVFAQATADTGRGTIGGPLGFIGWFKSARRRGISPLSLLYPRPVASVAEAYTGSQVWSDWVFQNTGGPSTIAIGQPAETDTAQPFTARQLRAIGQPAETDTAQPFTLVQSRTIGQPSETDTAQAFAQTQARAIGQALETDSAQPFSQTTAVAIGQPAETDTAQPFAQQQARAIGQAVETDSAQPLAAAQARAIGQPVETDSAQPFTISTAKVMGQVLETDSAQPFAQLQVRAIGQALEADSAQPFAAAQVRAIGQPAETDSAQPFTQRQARTIGQTVETDTAQPFGTITPGTIAQVTETDLAQAFVARLLQSIGQALETDSAQPMGRLQARTIGQPSELDSALAFAQQQLRAIGIAVEFDTALAFNAGGAPGTAGLVFVNGAWQYKATPTAGDLLLFLGPDGLVHARTTPASGYRRITSAAGLLQAGAPA